jgi:hypothetical protein
MKTISDVSVTLDRVVAQLDLIVKKRKENRVQKNAAVSCCAIIWNACKSRNPKWFAKAAEMLREVQPKLHPDLRPEIDKAVPILEQLGTSHA